MPALADVTVKKDDGVTDIVYKGITPSGADGTRAVLRQDAGQPADMPMAHRPRLEVRSMSNGPGTARRVEGVYSYPYSVLNSTTNRRETKDKVLITISAVLPGEIPVSVINEASTQGANLFASVLFRACLKEGTGPS